MPTLFKNAAENCNHLVNYVTITTLAILGKPKYETRERGKAG